MVLCRNSKYLTFSLYIQRNIHCWIVLIRFGSWKPSSMYYCIWRRSIHIAWTRETTKFLQYLLLHCYKCWHADNWLHFTCFKVISLTIFWPLLLSITVTLYGYQSFLLLLSNDVKCFGEDSCYSLAFGTATILMLIAAIVLILGKTHYIKNNPVGSIMTQVVGIIWVKITF